MNEQFPMSKHACLRARERGIPEIANFLLLTYECSEPAGLGATSYSFDKKAWRKIERLFGHWPLKKMEQLKRTYIVVADDGAAITVAYKH